MTFIWWIYHFWARFWPYFNFVDFRAYFGPFSLVNRDRQKMADLLRKMASNQKMQENKPTLKFNFTIEKRWPVSIFELFGPQHLSHWALLYSSCFHDHQFVFSGALGNLWQSFLCSSPSSSSLPWYTQQVRVWKNVLFQILFLTHREKNYWRTISNTGILSWR